MIPASLRKAAKWVLIMISAPVVIIVLYYLFFFVEMFVVLPLDLYFEQDYHFWTENVSDLAAFRSGTQVFMDSQELSRAVSAASISCAEMTPAIQHQPFFFVAANTYCKIRSRSECPCSNDSSRGYWIKVHVTRGPQKGKEGWICREDVGLTVALP